MNARTPALPDFWRRQKPWDFLEIERIDDWQIASAQAPTGRWWAWAKMGQIQGQCPLSEPGNYVWANFGETREEALGKTKEELGLNR